MDGLIEERIITVIEQAKLDLERRKLELLALVRAETQALPAHAKEETESLVSPARLAELLDISESQVRRLEKAGEIPSYRPGGLLRFDFDEVKAALRQQSLRKAS